MCAHFISSYVALFTDHSAISQASIEVFRMSLVLVVHCNHDYVCAHSGLKIFDVLSGPSLSPVLLLSIMQREDPHKIFLGSLDPSINKPKLLALFSGLDLNPIEVIVPECRQCKLAVAFITWGTPEEAWAAVQACNGLVNTEFAPNRILVHIWGRIMGVCINSSG